MEKTSSRSPDSNSDQNVDPATQFYQDRMRSFLKQSKIPPTEWELNQRHELIHEETLTRFGSNNDSFEDEIEAAYSEVKKNHKELRSRILIEAVLGR